MGRTAINKRTYKAAKPRKGRRGAAKRKTCRALRAVLKGGNVKVKAPLESKLCTLAVSDARHDFKEQSYIDNAREMLPGGITGCSEVYNENGYLYNYLGIERNRQNTFDIAEDSELLRKYEYTQINTAGAFHEHFSSRSLENIFLVVDTYSEGLSYVLANAERARTDVKYYWVQNKQTLFDPAGKTNEKTKRGKELFFKKWPETERNPFVTFCWETSAANELLIDRYPPWVEKSDISGNRLLFSNSEIFQILYEKDSRKSSAVSREHLSAINGRKDTNNFKKQETRCIMRTPENKIIVFNKKMSSINAVISIAANYDLYKSMETEIDKLIEEYGEGDEEYGRFLKRHHCLAKRLGDQAQALSCLKPEFELRHNDSVTGQIAEHNIISNSNHAFVSIDLLSMASAVLYEVPIIIYCFRHGPLGIFIRRDIMNPTVIIAGLKQKYIQVLAELRDAREEYLKAFAEYGVVSYDLKLAIKEGLDMPIKSEEEYRAFMKYMLEVSYRAAVVSHLDKVKIMRMYEPPENVNDKTEANIKEVYKMINDMRKSISSYKYGVMCIDAVKKGYLRISENDVNMKMINKSNLHRNMVRYIPRLLVASVLSDTLIPHLLAVHREISAVFDKLGVEFVGKLIGLAESLDNNYKRAIHFAFIKAGVEHPGLVAEEEGAVILGRKRGRPANNRNDNGESGIAGTPPPKARRRLVGGAGAAGISEQLMLELVAKSAVYLYIVCKKRHIAINNYLIDDLMRKVHSKIVGEIKAVLGEVSKDGDEEVTETSYYVDSIEPQMMFDKDLYSLYELLEEEFPLRADRVVSGTDGDLLVKETDVNSIEFPIDLINKLNKFISIDGRVEGSYISPTIQKMNAYSKTMRRTSNARRRRSSFKTKQAVPYLVPAPLITVGFDQNDFP